MQNGRYNHNNTCDVKNDIYTPPPVQYSNKMIECRVSWVTWLRLLRVELGSLVDLPAPDCHDIRCTGSSAPLSCWAFLSAACTEYDLLHYWHFTEWGWARGQSVAAKAEWTLSVLHWITVPCGYWVQAIFPRWQRFAIHDTSFPSFYYFNSSISGASLFF